MLACPSLSLVQLSRYRISKWAQKCTFCNILQHIDDGLSLVGHVVQSLPHGVWEIQQKVQVQRVLLGLTQPEPKALFLLKPQIHSHWLWLDEHRVSRCGAQGRVPLNSWGWGLRLKDPAFGSLNLPNASGTCPLKGLTTRKNRLLNLKVTTLRAVQNFWDLIPQTPNWKLAQNVKVYQASSQSEVF